MTATAVEVGTIRRAEVVGSLLRPQYLSHARADLESGRIGVPEFKRVEDRAVDQAIALQEGVGLDVVSDGELRRFSFLEHWTGALEGVVPVQTFNVAFHSSNGLDDFQWSSPVAAVERIRLRRKVTIEEFAYARARARVPVKVTLPSPLLLYTLWSPERSRDAYPDIFDLFEDGVELLRDEISELAALGCTYVQIDAPDLGTIVDPAHRALREAHGMSTERTLGEGIDLMNAVADVPGVTFGLHLCKGNYLSRWISEGGYDLLAEAVFKRASNYDVFLLEYDDERSGTFEPLALVPNDKVVVLGLVSSKTTELEPVDRLVARIDEAARYHPRDQLALSTQCGFASVSVGANLITEGTQEAKLRLVADVAHEVWG